MEITVVVCSRHNGELIRTTAQNAKATEAGREQGEMIACKALASAIAAHLDTFTTNHAGVISGPLEPLIAEASLFTEWMLLGEIETTDEAVLRYKVKLKETLQKLLEDPHTYRPRPGFVTVRVDPADPPAIIL